MNLSDQDVENLRTEEETESPKDEAAESPEHQQDELSAGVEKTHQDREQDFHPELVNLAAQLNETDSGRDHLKDIGILVYDDYEEDEHSRTQWVEKMTVWQKVYDQMDRPMLPPWSGSSEESMPILTEACLQFHARAYKGFFGEPHFITAMPIGGPADNAPAMTPIAMAMAGQAQQAQQAPQQPGQPPPAAQATQAAPQTLAPPKDPHGDQQQRAQRVGAYMSWDMSIRDRSFMRNKDRLLRALPLLGSYFTKTYRDPSAKTNVVENVHPMNLVVSYSNIGVDIEDVERKTQIVFLSMRKARWLASQGWFIKTPQSFTGTSANPEYQQTVEDLSGVRKPYFSKEPDAKILEQHRWLDLDGDGIDEPYIVWIDASTREVLRMTIRYEVDPKTGAPTNHKAPIEYFTHYVYFENPTGFYGHGLGHLLGNTNRAVNKLLRQAIDASTLATLHTGFATKSAGLKKQYIEFELGKIVTLDGNVDDIRKHIYFVDHPGPSAGHIEMMNLLIQSAERLGQVTEMLTGDADKVYQPTTANALIEQGLMTFSAVQIRVHNAMEQELQKVYRLYKLYADQQTYFTFNDGQGPKDYTVFAQDFQDNIHVQPAMDPTQASQQQKLQRAQMEYQTAMTNPIIGEVPRCRLNATARFLRAIGCINTDEIIPTVQEMMQLQQAAQSANQGNAGAEKEKVQLDAQMKQAGLQIQQQRNQITAATAQTSAQLKQAKMDQSAELNSQKLDLRREELTQEDRHHTLDSISDAFKQANKTSI